VTACTTVAVGFAEPRPPVSMSRLRWQPKTDRGIGRAGAETGLRAPPAVMAGLAAALALSAGLGGPLASHGPR